MTTTNMFLNFGGKWDCPPGIESIKPEELLEIHPISSGFYSYDLSITDLSWANCNLEICGKEHCFCDASSCSLTNSDGSDSSTFVMSN